VAGFVSSIEKDSFYQNLWKLFVTANLAFAVWDNPFFKELLPAHMVLTRQGAMKYLPGLVAEEQRKLKEMAKAGIHWAASSDSATFFRVNYNTVVFTGIIYDGDEPWRIIQVTGGCFPFAEDHDSFAIDGAVTKARFPILRLLIPS
jgi:hypothetical protein